SALTETNPIRGTDTTPPTVYVPHDLQPHRSGTGNTAHIPHRLTGKISRPNPHGVVARVSDAPVVAHVLARSCLHRGPEGCGQGVFEPKGGAATLAVGEHV